jgi:hypothetical protein
MPRRVFRCATAPAAACGIFLQENRKIQARTQPCAFRKDAHLPWVDARDTPTDIRAERNRLIAAGRARPDDTFVHVRWKTRGET